jgi:hypothetical protein
MPEWGTLPANHYLPRRRTQITLHPDDLQRRDNPLAVDGGQPGEGAHGEPGREDFAT